MYNAIQIYDYYQLFDDFIKDNRLIDDDLKLYNSFKKYVEKNNDLKKLLTQKETLSMFFKKVSVCHNILCFLGGNIIKKDIIHLLLLMELNVEKIIKLKDPFILKLKDFLKDKYNKIGTKKYLKINNYNDEKNKLVDIDKCNIKLLKNIYNDIPINYLGCKRYLANTILTKIKQNPNMKTFTEIFSGCLCMSFIIKKLYPDVSIISYENNKLLMNFYSVLKNDYYKFINKLVEIIHKLDKTINKVEYIKNIVDEVNSELKNSIIFNKINIACYYYILNKVIYRGIMKYTKDGSISVSINEKRIENLTKFNEKHQQKLYNYSVFLKSIKLIDVDVTNNYDKILEKMEKNTIVYVDPPYDSETNGYKNYQQIFDRTHQVDLKVFLDKAYKKGIRWLTSNNYTGFISELYYKYNRCILDLKERINKSLKQELLISSF